MRFFLFISVFIFCINNSYSQTTTIDPYDETDFFFDSLYAVQNKKQKEIKDSIALSGTYERLNEAIKNPLTVTELRLKNSTIVTLPEGIETLVNVESVVFDGCKNIDLEDAFEKLASLPKLKSLEIIRCKKYSFPDNIEKLTALENLNLIGNKVVRLPETIANLEYLKSINVSNNVLLNETIFFTLINTKTDWESVKADYCQIRELPVGKYDIENLSLKGNLLYTVPKDMQVKNLSLSSNPNLDLDDLFENLMTSSIESMDLSYSSITVLSDKIKSLSSLKHLYLQGNMLTNLPDEIGDLTGLITLDIGNEDEYLFTNQITSLPSSLGNLRELNYLDLTGNKIEKIPSSFDKLTSLVFLDLTWNKLDYFPEEIVSMTNLEHLNLSFNAVKTIPENIGDLVNLNYLNLSGDFFFHYTTKIKTVPSSIGGLSNLDTLILKDNVIEELPQTFSELDLVYFDIADNLISTLPEGFGSMTRLTYLDMAANEFTSLPSDFSDLSALNYLDMSLNFNMDTDVEAAKLAKLGNLKYLNIADSHFTITAVELLQEELTTTEIVTAMDRGEE